MLLNIEVVQCTRNHNEAVIANSSNVVSLHIHIQKADLGNFLSILNHLIHIKICITSLIF